MKIVVKSKDTNIKIYVPMFILTSGLRFSKFITKEYSKHGKTNNDKKDLMKYMNYIDMDIIIYAIKELKIYKGLTLVEVKANDGTYVLIKV